MLDRTASEPQSRARLLAGGFWPGWACDDLRLVGLKLIFLVVSRRVIAVLVTAVAVVEGRRDPPAAAPARRPPARAAELAPRHCPAPVGHVYPAASASPAASTILPASPRLPHPPDPPKTCPERRDQRVRACEPRETREGTGHKPESYFPSGTGQRSPWRVRRRWPKRITWSSIDTYSKCRREPVGSVALTRTGSSASSRA
jgi:hypothetical protein